MKDFEQPPGLPQGRIRWPGVLARPEVRISVVYVVLASIWILGSDSLLSYLCGASDQSVTLQTFKGLNFVLTTGLMLYLVLRRSFGGWRRAETLRMETVQSSSERLRKLSARIETLREEERARISREIHDELGQLLTGIHMQLRCVENQLSGRDDRSLNPLIDELVETSSMIDEVVASVRRIASGLRPLSLDDLGLAAALNGEAEQFSRRTGIACNLELGGSLRPLDPGIEITVFRIFQECLTNVARHAKASSVSASCFATSTLITLQVRDDGVGMETEGVANPSALGITGMTERAAAVGGSLVIHSRAGGGTTIRLEIPLPPASTPNTAASNEDPHH